MVTRVGDREVESSRAMGVKKRSLGYSRKNPWDNGTGNDKRLDRT